METDISQTTARSPAIRADARRKHLLETARALFTAQGFHQTGMAKIAEVSQVKVGQIYRDFSSKEDIIAAIAEADVSAWLCEEELAAAVSLGDRGAVRAWIRRIASHLDQKDACLLAEIVAEVGRNGRVAAIHREMDTRIRGTLAAALAALAPSPDKAGEREQLTEMILGMGVGLMVRQILNPEMDLPTSCRLMVDIIDDRIDLLTGETAGR
ncbi:TetR/AcrR family transcriptional regulator [Stakelama tenebrarum]|uniref:TetR/AcrR family transcriptional regulator n=1 Tax=Stakelama tenebrarum TaxID=2711215 RepID=A0A6G6Y4M6_9SPHN|nr:TetR/AcrR family transcriptional regulator [Sphingosinithalassobacter tenebrarum]QIG79865.1 TetR/AcrR family transcriptional regulator [Sphingosinithalassobacter tenebrarum]